jgi:hypothetical protein
VCYLYTRGRIRPPAGRRGGDDAAELFLASTAGQEPFHGVVRRRARAFPLASKAGQEKTPPAASALQQVVHRHSFIKKVLSPEVQQLVKSEQIHTITCKSECLSTQTCSERTNRYKTNQKTTCGYRNFVKKTLYVFLFTYMSHLSVSYINN